MIDAGGVEAFTMRQLGKTLGVDPMMIYRYFPSKSSVLDAVMGMLWTSIDLRDINSNQPWTAVLADIIHQLRRSLLSHPRAISIVGTRPATGPDLLILLEHILEVLRVAGMPLTPATADLLNALVNYTVGHVLAESGDPVGGEAEQQNTAFALSDFPNLAYVFGSGWQYDASRQFNSALHAMIAGANVANTSVAETQRV